MRSPRAEQCRAAGLRGVACSSAQAYPEATSIAVSARRHLSSPSARRRSSRGRRARPDAVLPRAARARGRLAFARSGRHSGGQAQASRPRRETVTMQAAPDAVRGDAKAAPALAVTLGRDAPGPEAGMGEREGKDALLEVRPKLVRHPWRTRFPHPERVHSPAVDAALPAVVGRVVHTHRPTGGTNARSLPRARRGASGSRRGRHHATPSSPRRGLATSMSRLSRRPDATLTRVRRPVSKRSLGSREVSRELGVSSP